MKIKEKPSSFPDELPTISIETLGGISIPVYCKGELVPFKKSIVYSTVADNQAEVEIHLVLGESKWVCDNVSLGIYRFDGIPPAKRGVPQIEIQFKVDKDFNLNIMATEKSTGRTKHLGNVNLTNYLDLPIKGPLSTQSDLREYQRPLEISLEEAYTGKTCFVEINGTPMRIDIPAGAEMGSKLRLVGVGPNGADFCLVILIRPHPVFVRRDLNVYVLYPVSETLAYYGGEMQVPVLEMNKSICFAIPANTKDRQIFRFANKGFPNVDEPTEFGDLYLVVALYDPRSMPQEFKELLEDINNYMR